MTAFERDGEGPPRMTRRTALARGAGGLLATAGAGALLDALGGSAAASAAAALKGTITLLTYPNWYGPKELTGFEKLHPGLTVKTAVSGTNGAAAQIAQISTNRGAFDLTLAGTAVAPELQLASLLQPLDEAAVPNLSLVSPVIRKSFPWGIPTDLGKTGFAYRKDLIKERPASWHDFWALAKKYSGKVTIVKYDVGVQGSALKYLVYSINSKSTSQLQAMQKALLDRKPHLQAILETDYSKSLIEGTTVMAMDYDYDIAAAAQRNKNIVWVAPKEGLCGHAEGWVALKGSSNLPAVWALMNYHLAAKNYASFVNANGPSYVEQSAARYIKSSITGNASLRFDSSEFKRIEFDTYLGPKTTAYRAKLWEEFLAA